MKKALNLDRSFVAKLMRRLRELNRDYFPESNEGLLPKKFFPTAAEVTAILTEAFWASTQFEEGRPLRFRVAYAPPTGLEHIDFTFDVMGTRRWRSEEIRRLAPAIAPPDGAMLVGKLLGFDELRILGMGDCPILAVQFEALDPARIVVRFPFARPVAELSSTGTGFISQDWSDQVAAIFVDREIGEDLETVQKLVVRTLRDQMLTETLKRIRILRHGGTVLVVDGSTDWRKATERASIPSFIYRYNGLRHIADGIGQRVAEAGDDQLQRAIALRDALADHRVRTFLGNAARTVAYLTQIDGALVINSEFDVLGFGVKINEKTGGAKQSIRRLSPYEVEGNVSSDEVSLLTREYKGKRHLSSARFVLKNPTARAFTISQDGGITGFVTQDGELRAYSGLELNL